MTAVIIPSSRTSKHMDCVQKSVFPTPAPAPRRYVSPHRRPKVHLVSVGLHQGIPHSTGWSAEARRSATVKMPSGLNRSEEHTSELQSLMRISYAVFCLKKKKTR